jgi:hypothetical protein
MEMGTISLRQNSPMYEPSLWLPPTGNHASSHSKAVCSTIANKQPKRTLGGVSVPGNFFAFARRCRLHELHRNVAANACEVGSACTRVSTPPWVWFRRLSNCSTRTALKFP